MWVDTDSCCQAVIGVSIFIYYMAGFIYLYTYSLICLSVCLPVCLSVCLSVCLLFSLIYLFAYWFVCLCIRLFVSVCAMIHYLSVYYSRVHSFVYLQSGPKFAYMNWVIVFGSFARQIRSTKFFVEHLFFSLDFLFTKHLGVIVYRPNV